jgi:hypothetical protein
LVAVAISTAAVAMSIEPAAAHRSSGRYPVAAWSCNEANIRQHTGQAGIDSVYAMDWEWEVEDGRKWADPYASNTTSDRVLRFVPDGFDGMFGVYARANGECGSGMTCWINFDMAERWNTTWELRDSMWLDFRSIVLHEFGHWMGAGHTFDRPAPDTREPVMTGSPYGPTLLYGQTKRSLTLDDIQALHAARNYVTIITADDSLEYHGLYHFVERVVSGGGYEFRCDGAGYGSNCYYRNWGAGSSIYQEVAPRGAYMNLRDVRARVRFRNRTGQAGTVTVAVWNVEAAPAILVKQSVCNLPTDTSWIQCATPYFQYSEKLFRIEAYNNNAGSVDIDTVIFG